MIKFVFHIGVICIIYLFTMQTSFAQPQLTYYTENYPPSNYLENGKLTGVSVETLKAIWQQLNIPAQPIHLVPWARGYKIVENTPNTVLFTMAKTKARTPHFKWVGPLYIAEHLLISGKQFKAKINSMSDVYSYSIAAIKSDISEITLIKKGVPNEKIVRISQLRQGILMLTNDRIDLMIISRSALGNLLKNHQIKESDIQIVYSVNRLGNYFAFHKDTPNNLIDQFQSTFDQIYPIRKKINKKYKLLTPELGIQ